MTFRTILTLQNVIVSSGSVTVMMSSIKIRRCIPEIAYAKWLYDLAVILTLDLLTSKSNHFIFVSNCTRAVNSVKFHKRFVRYRAHNFDHECTDGRTAQTECHQRLIAGGDIQSNGCSPFSHLSHPNPNSNSYPNIILTLNLTLTYPNHNPNPS